MVELQSLDPMGSQEQHSLLPPADVLCPLSQPLDEVIDRILRTSSLLLILTHTFAQHLHPWTWLQPCQEL